MKKALTLVLLLISAEFSFGQDRKNYQYQNNIPSIFGIQYYIDLNTDNIVSAVENFIDDSILSYSIKVDNLSVYHVYDSLEARTCRRGNSLPR